MDISYFQEFVTLCETRNYTEAAERLFISQASLSKHIQAMEKELGEKLFLRSTRKLELTDYGKVFFSDAEQIANQQKAYLEKLREWKSSEAIVLRIGSTPGLPQYNLTQLFSDFSVTNPNIKLSMFCAGDELLFPAMKEQKCTLIIARGSAIPADQCTIIPILTDFICVALSKRHPLAGQKTLSLRQIQNEQLVLFKSDTFVSHFLDSLFYRENFSPAPENIVGRFLSFYAIMDLIKKNLGVTVISYRTALFDADDSIDIIPLEPYVPFDLCLAYLNDRTLSEADRSFIRYTRKFFASKDVPLFKKNKPENQNVEEQHEQH